MSQKKGEPRQSRPGNIIKTVLLNNREATTTKGAISILEGITGHKYSRDAIYRLYIDGKIEGERTDVANFYYIDSLQKAKDKLSPGVGRKKNQSNYPQETREQALRLHEQGMTNRAIASELHVTNQTVHQWIQKQQKTQPRS